MIQIGKDEVKPKTDSDPGYVMFGGMTMGNVYGGGKGDESHTLVGVVKGNTKVTIEDNVADADYAATHEGVNAGDVLSPKIYHNVYGGLLEHSASLMERPVTWRISPREYLYNGKKAQVKQQSTSREAPSVSADETMVW